MALYAEILDLRVRTLSDLNAAHDYYWDTIQGWGLVQKVIVEGKSFVFENISTKSKSTQDDLVRKSRGYMDREVLEMTFQQFLSIFEGYVFDVLKLWHSHYPQSLRAKKIDVGLLLDAQAIDKVLDHVISKEVNDILYGRPASWFACLEDKVKLGCPSSDEIEKFSEAKAARDLLVHNRGIANATYVLKAGKFARCKEGQRIVVTERYHREVWELLYKIASETSTALLEKAV